MAERRGWSLVETLILVVVLGIAAALLIPGRLKSRKVEAEGKALRAFGEIQAAEDRIYSEDLDGNRAMDYWTRDIRGLTRFRAGLDDRIAAADGASADCREYSGHHFRMVELDEDGNPLADSSGMGPRLIFSMIPARQGEFAQTRVRVRDRCWYGKRDGGVVVRRWIRNPAGEGWAILD